MLLSKIWVKTPSFYGGEDVNDKIPPEALGEFLKAIGAYIVNHKA